MKWGTKKKDQICKRVKQIREEKVGTGRGAQRLAAKMLGVPYTTFRGYEANRVNLDFLYAFSKKFNISTEWLLGFDIDESGAEKHLRIKQIKNAEPFIIMKEPYCIVPMIDSSMEPSIKQGSLVVVAPVTDYEHLDNKMIAIWETEDEVQIRRVVKRGHKLLGLPDNPVMKQKSITIDPKKILGVVTVQFNIPI